jgi:dTDP-4-dehydrorhamnose 3,5-epimerase
MNDMSQKQFELKGIEIIDVKKNPDERGFFAEVLRKDWSDFFTDDWISQANVSQSYPGIIRAWHRHARGQIDYFLVLEGAMKIVAYDGNEESSTYGTIAEIVTSEHRLQVVRIPGHYWHGTMTIGNKPSVTIYFVSHLYDHNNPDEERRPWNDPSVINSRTNIPYDWNKPPHK